VGARTSSTQASTTDRARRQRVGAYAIAQDSGGRLLLVRASGHLAVAGMWFLPGGGIEHDETPEDALRREVHEETGLLVGEPSLLGVLSDTWPLSDGTLLHTIRLIYRIGEWQGTLRHETAGSSDLSAWVSRSELTSLRLVPYVKEALDRFAAEVPARLDDHAQDCACNGGV
jgi:8-oxo-dGTP diphosphatase